MRSEEKLSYVHANCNRWVQAHWKDQLGMLKSQKSPVDNIECLYKIYLHANKYKNYVNH